jgi:methionyl-tRNA formyltransferase
MNDFAHAKMNSMETRIIFLGSSQFAVTILDSLVQEYKVSAVVTQPDRPSGRGAKTEYSATKKLALSLGLNVLQPDKIKDAGFISILADHAPDLIVVAAYGQILSKQLIELPRFGCINVHASLLPRWRGASPTQSAILAGDEVTGVTIMKMDEGLDTGPILSQSTLSIDPSDNASTLSEKLSNAGAELLVKTLDGYLTGKIQPVQQDNDKATMTRLLRKSDGQMDFNQPAAYLERMVRAYDPWPGAYFQWNDQLIKVFRAHVDAGKTIEPGVTSKVSKKPAFGTGEGVLVLDVVQPQGRRVMTGEEFLNGVRNWLKGGK